MAAISNLFHIMSYLTVPYSTFLYHIATQHTVESYTLSGPKDVFDFLLSLTTAWVGIKAQACEQFASDLGMIFAGHSTFLNLSVTN